MSTVRHGGFAIDVPDGWSDQSTLLFVAPRLASDPRSLHGEVKPTETISVRFVLGAGAGEAGAGALELDAAGLLASQVEALKVTDPDFTVLATGPFTSGLGEGWQQTQRITVGGVALLQLATATVIGPIAILATATAAEAKFANVEAQLTSVLSSMKAVR